MIPEWLSYVDVTFVVVALFFAWGGAQKGFAGQMAPILTLLIMAPILYFAYPAIYEALGDLFRRVDEGMLMWLLLVGVVALAVGVFALFSKLLAKMLELQVSPRSDTAYGLILGLVRGTFSGVFVMIFLVMIGPPKFYESFSAKSYVGTLVCDELVPVIQPNFMKIVHAGKMKGAKAKLLEQEDAGVYF
ncbi:MAG: CvpA family protein [Pontiella sp.]